MAVTATVNLIRPQRTINDVITPGVYNGDTVAGVAVEISGALAADGGAPQTAPQAGDWRVEGTGHFGALNVSGASAFTTLTAAGASAFTTLSTSGTASLASAAVAGPLTVAGVATLNGNLVQSFGKTATFNGDVYVYGRLRAHSNSLPGLEAWSLSTGNYAHIGGADNANNGPASKIRRLYVMQCRCTLPALAAGGAAWYCLSPIRDTVFEQFTSAWQSAYDASAYDASSYKIVRTFDGRGRALNAAFVGNCSDVRLAADAITDTTNTRLQLRNVSGSTLAAGTTVDVAFFMVSPYSY